MLRLGLTLTFGSLIGALSQLLVRWIIQADYGATELGIFQAAWMVSVVYMSFLFSAMSSDFYPRLTAAIHDRRRAGLIINRQLEVCVLLATPIILACTVLSSIIVSLLFTSEFAPAAELLRWLIVADFFKVIFWAPGFVLLSGGRGRVWASCEAFNGACFVGLSWLLIGRFGLAGVGMAYALSMAIYIPLIATLAYHYVRFRPSRAIVRLISLQAAALTASLVLRSVSVIGSEIVGTVFAMLFGGIAVRQLGPSLPDPFGRIYKRFNR
jgi:PST family polysaccharide transporter